MAGLEPPMLTQPKSAGRLRQLSVATMLTVAPRPGQFSRNHSRASRWASATWALLISLAISAR